jgi:trimethylamine--corrinoid protein Co-methyltransferase
VFYTPLLSDWRNFETWQEDGALHASKRANKIWKSLLQEYSRPVLDEGILEELKSFIERRKLEIANGQEDAVLHSRD